MKITGLTLSRNLYEDVLIGDDICVTVTAVRGNNVTLSIKAPQNVIIDRREVRVKRLNDEKIKSSL